MLNIIKKTKKDYKKQLIKNIKNLLKKKKEKSNNMVVKVIKTSQEMKKINWLSIKIYYRMRKSNLLELQVSILIQKTLFLYKKKYKFFWIFRPSKFLP